jgi:membrane protein DedA with SNARE-associated domain
MIYGYIADIFTNHHETIMHYRYLVLFLFATFEGTITMLTAGGLAAAGILNWPIALGICAFAEIVDGFFWYWVGYNFGAKPIDFFVRNSPARRAFVDAIKHHANRAAGLVILAVKMTYSVSNPTLIFIGSLKYKLSRFAIFNVIGSIGWAAMLLSLGYFFGQAAFYYLGFFRQAGLAVFFIIASLFALLVLKESGNFALNKLSEELEEGKMKE